MLDGLASIHHDKIKFGIITTDYLVKLFTSSSLKESGSQKEFSLIDDQDITFTEG